MLSPHLQSVLRRVQRPARYAGGEWNAVRKEWAGTPVRLVLLHADSYESGMASLEYQELYRAANERDGVLCERAFTPRRDMAGELRRSGERLYGLESGQPLTSYSAVAAHLERPLQATNLLESLALAGVPAKASQRNGRPGVIGLGSRLRNWEPLAPFFDIILAGEPREGFEALITLLAQGLSRERLLAEAARVPGCYVPSFFQPSRDGGLEVVCGRISPAITAQRSAALPPPLTTFVVPNMETPHEHASIEVQRGCNEECAGCRAGGPCTALRTRTAGEVLEAIEAIGRRSGYREMELRSPSCGDWRLLLEIAALVKGRFAADAVLLYLPALSLERHSDGEVLELTAAGLRLGLNNVRLGCELGRPGAEAKLAHIEGLVGQLCARDGAPRGGRPKVRIEVEWFSARPGTEGEREAVAPPESSRRLLEELRKRVRRMGAHLAALEPEAAWVEAAVMRGDRRMAEGLEEAWRLGASVPPPGQSFDAAPWLNGLATAGSKAAELNGRALPDGESLPWAHIASGPGNGERQVRTCRSEPCPVCSHFAAPAVPG